MALLMKPGGRRGRRRQLQSEINVTPFVDVMLVLLIVFMITARLLIEGVDVNLPNADARSLPAPDTQPLTVTLQADGRLFVQQQEIPMGALVPRLEAIAATGYDERIYVRGDDTAAYGDVARLLTRIERAGFRKVSLVMEREDARN